MIECIRQILPGAHIFQLNILFLMGLALFGGTIGGKFFQKIRIPQVVGYIVIGILIGHTGLRIIDMHTVDMMQPFNYFALGIIGFMIGGELKKSVLAKYGKQFVYILFSEGLITFFVVALLIFVIGGLFLETKTAVSLALLLGAIAAATAPAATTDVLWEYKTRGPLTSTVLGIIAMDDGLSLLLFAVASSIAMSLTGFDTGGWLPAIFYPVYEVLGSLAVGVLAGLILSKLLRKYTEEERILVFSIGMVLLVLGIAQILKVDILLAAMAMGIMLVNYSPRKSELVFTIVNKFVPPIYVLFFVMFGAKLDVGRLSLPTGILALLFLAGRSGGKMLGASFGTKIARSSEKVHKFLPFCLFSQAGVAIGLSIIAGHRFPGEIGDAIVIIITATTFVVQMLGPSFVKYAVTKAGEVGLNITEDDLTRQTKVSDLMDKEVPLISPKTPVAGVLKIFSEHTNLYYPVADDDKKLIGVVTIETIKDTFMASELSGFLLAYDLMSPPVAVISPDASLFKAKEILSRYNLECLPVVDSNERVIGTIENRAMRKLLSRKLLEIQKQADSLG
ncbi:MAG: cation:proton antiporter [bacterium]